MPTNTSDKLGAHITYTRQWMYERVGTGRAHINMIVNFKMSSGAHSAGLIIMHNW